MCRRADAALRAPSLKVEAEGFEFPAGWRHGSICNEHLCLHSWPSYRDIREYKKLARSWSEAGGDSWCLYAGHAQSKFWSFDSPANARQAYGMLSRVAFKSLRQAWHSATVGEWSRWVS